MMVQKPTIQMTLSIKVGRNFKNVLMAAMMAKGIYGPGTRGTLAEWKFPSMSFVYADYRNVASALWHGFSS